VILVEVGHAVVEVDGTGELFGEGESGGAGSGAKGASGEVVVAELDLLGADGGQDQGNAQTNTNTG
jgi:hypothetical protein